MLSSLLYLLFWLFFGAGSYHYLNSKFNDSKIDFGSLIGNIVASWTRRKDSSSALSKREEIPCHLAKELKKDEKTSALITMLENQTHQKGSMIRCDQTKSEMKNSEYLHLISLCVAEKVVCAMMPFVTPIIDDPTPNKKKKNQKELEEPSIVEEIKSQ